MYINNRCVYTVILLIMLFISTVAYVHRVFTGGGQVGRREFSETGATAQGGGQNSAPLPCFTTIVTAVYPQTG